jgi:glycosyltransferase involved in cell wall biosynthesis
LPLVFYKIKNNKNVSVIFANMDSWFSEVHNDMKKFWYRKYYSFNYILENADAVDFLSPYIYEGIKQKNIDIKQENVFIAPCSFTDYSKCIPSNKSNFEVVFSARLEPDKNPMLYLEAVKLIHEKYPNVKFHLLGQGSLYYEIKNFIETNSLSSKINFTFHKNPPEILANSSIFVSLQSNTNYPSQSILEAMACENSIIASNTGDTNLFISKQNGILINLNLNELVLALEYLINNPEQTKKLGKYGRIYVLKYHTSQKYINYFTDMLCKVHSEYN